MMNRIGYAKDLPVVAERSAAMSLPSDFMRLSGTGRLKAILDLPEPARFLKRLREDEFVYLVNGIGLEDAGCLIPMSTGRQRRTLVDMDAWTGSEFVPARFDRLLDVARESGLEFTVRLLKDLDPEVLVLSLFKRASFHTMEEAEDMEFEDGTTFLTPDNVFVVACFDADDVPVVRGELDLIYAIGVEFAHRLIQAGRWDNVSSLEHQSYSYRASRLSEAGFPDRDNEYEIYEPFDLNSFRERILSPGQGGPVPGTTRGEALALAVAGTPGTLFFWRVLDAAVPGTLDTAYILAQTLNLINRVLGFRKADLSDSAAWESVAEHTLTVVSVGLEAVTGNDVAVGLDVLRRSVPLELFRAGVETIRPVNILARQVIGDIGGIAGLSLFGTAGAADIDAAAAFPPLCPPSIAQSAARDFHSVSEIALALRLMKKFKSVVQFATVVLGFNPGGGAAPIDSMVRPTFAGVVATAWARQILDGRLSIEPLTADDVRRLRQIAFDDGRIKSALRVGGGTETDEYSSLVAEFLDDALDAVEESIGGLHDEFDVRMIGDSVLVR